MPYGAPEGSFLYWVTRRSAALTGGTDARPIATIRMMLLGFIIMSPPEMTSGAPPAAAACRDRLSVAGAAAAVYWNIDGEANDALLSLRLMPASLTILPRAGP